jgi:transcription antitermination factor NusG
MDTFWICIQTKSGKEFQVEHDLDVSGYEVYLPRKRIDLRTKRTRKVIVEALYPCYLFCQILPEVTDIHPIKQTDNVMRLVQFGGELAKVSDNTITALKSCEDGQGVHEHKHEYAPGDPVRVKSGPFQQYEAVINSLSKHDRAIIELIDSNKPIEIRLINLEPVT